MNNVLGELVAIKRPPSMSDRCNPHHVVLTTVYHPVAADNDLTIPEAG